jgi:NAD(P)-dependent dehydrogenase (short-subunit alcohol dehydrogenase family)
MKNKVVLITGGNRGLGYGIAKAFLADTYKVVINFKSNEEATSKALAELSSDRVIAIKADVSKKEERISLLKETLIAFGQIDILVNNPAVASRYSF